MRVRVWCVCVWCGVCVCVCVCVCVYMCVILLDFVSSGNYSWCQRAAQQSPSPVKQDVVSPRQPVAVKQDVVSPRQLRVKIPSANWQRERQGEAEGRAGCYQTHVKGIWIFNLEWICLLNTTLRRRKIETVGRPSFYFILCQPRLRLWFLRPDLSLTERVNLPARVSAHDPQFSLSPSHYFLSDLIGNVIPHYKVPLRVLVDSTSRVGRSGFKANTGRVICLCVKDLTVCHR
jgi:hypothetical protein